MDGGSHSGKAEDLDALVHETAAAAASDINNVGLDAQIEYLIEEQGLEETRASLAGLLGDRAKPGDSGL